MTCGLLVSLACTFALAPQGRDVSHVAAPTSRIAGVVQTVERAPLARVVVTASSPVLPLGRSTVTDEEGRFSIDGLPAGTFTITAERPGYVTTTYGASAWGGRGIPLIVSVGHSISDLVLTMPLTAVIEGHIRDASGAWLPGVSVSALRVLSGRVTALPSATTFTDDRGRYRLFGLAPGRYVVAATQPQSVFRKGVGVLSSTEIDALLAALARGQKRPDAVGAGEVAVDERPIDPIPIFYPGAASAADAQAITVDVGEQRSNIDVILQVATLTALEGTIVNPSMASGITVTLMPADSDLALAATRPMQARPGPDGAFQFTGVRPGRYVVRGRGTGPAAAGAPGAGSVHWAEAYVDVNGTPVSGLSLVLEAAVSATGRVRWETGGEAPRPAGGVRVVISTSADRLLRAAALSGVVGGGAFPTPAAVGTDGTFRVSGLAPGTYAIDLEGIPEGWWMRSAIVEGIDVLDTGLEIARATRAVTVTVTLSNRPTKLVGTLQTPATLSPAGFSIVAFPPDRALWRPGSRRIRATRVAADGQYELAGLPPGEYLLAPAVDADDDLLAPGLLEAIAANAMRIVLGEGEMKTCNLNAGGDK